MSEVELNPLVLREELKITLSRAVDRHRAVEGGSSICLVTLSYDLGCLNHAVSVATNYYQ